MTLSLLEAHAACTVAIAVNWWSRAYRILLLTRGTGHTITLGEALVCNAFGDAGAALTPIRIGGEPARLAGLMRARVPVVAALVALALEVVVEWPVMILAILIIGLRYAPAWWAEAGPRLGGAVTKGWPWFAGVALLTAGVWIATRRMSRAPARGAEHMVRRPIRRLRVYLRRTPWSVILATMPLSAINVATRLAILPILAATVEGGPELGPAIVGSFVLVYSQLALPTPSGAGAVELGFLGGAAGDLGDDARSLLFWWRGYTNGVGIVLGAAFALRYYGWRAVAALAQRGASR